MSQVTQILIQLSTSKKFWTLLIRKEIHGLWLMLHSLMMQSTENTEISSIYLDSFMHVIKLGTVLWSPIFQIPMSLTSIGSQSLSNPANTAIGGSMKQS